MALVTNVFPILIVHADVLSDAESVTSRTTDVEAVADTKTAVAASSGTSIKNQELPSLAMAQSVPLVAVDVIGKNRFIAATVAV